MKASIIVPTRNRVAYLLPRMRLLERNTPELSNGTAELIFSVDEDDTQTIELVRTCFSNCPYIINPKLEIPAVKWNNAIPAASGEWLVTVSDDSIVHPNWLTNALRMLTKGFIGLPDGVTGARNNYFTPLYMATREWLRAYNGGVLVIPAYKCWFADIETAERAHRSGTYTVGMNSVVEQLHADFKTAENDSIYDIGRQRRNDDYLMYEKRKALGFPDDFERVL